MANAEATGSAPGGGPEHFGEAREKVSSTAIASESHLFVDNVRFWSMFGVVAIHSALVFVEIQQPRPGLMEIIQTPFKFATIAFFLMSGFLAGRALETVAPLTYLKRRLRRVALPWACWISAMIAAFMVTDLLHHRVSFSLDHHLFALLASRITYCLFGTAYWFVPNLLLSMALLLLFRRQQRRLWFGAILFSFSFLYGLNIYTNWMPSRHTESLLGFVFYLWLGAFASHHQAALEGWMARVSTAQLGAAALFTMLLAYREAVLLDRLGSVDPLNSLRITNQLFSVMAVLFLYKFRRATWPGFVQVRDNTFGVYLLHPLTMFLLWPVLKSRFLSPLVHRLAGGDVGGVALWAGSVLCVYGGALCVTKLLVRQPSLSWLLGVQTLRKRASRELTLSTAEPDLSIGKVSLG